MGKYYANYQHPSFTSVSINLTFCYYSDKPYSMLKPGQTKTGRDYYQVVTTDKPDGKTVLNNFTRYSTNYDSKYNDNVQKGDHVIPAKSNNTMGKSNSKL